MYVCRLVPGGHSLKDPSTYGRHMLFSGPSSRQHGPWLSLPQPSESSSAQFTDPTGQLSSVVPKQTPVGSRHLPAVPVAQPAHPFGVSAVLCWQRSCPGEHAPSPFKGKHSPVICSRQGPTVPPEQIVTGQSSTHAESLVEHSLDASVYPLHMYLAPPCPVTGVGLRHGVPPPTRHMSLLHIFHESSVDVCVADVVASVGRRRQS